MPVIARKFPGQFAQSDYVIENRPVSRADPGALKLKKLVKRILATAWALAWLHRLVATLEARHVPEPLLRRLYTVLLGLHLFRGFRQSWRDGIVE